MTKILRLFFPFLLLCVLPRLADATTRYVIPGAGGTGCSNAGTNYNPTTNTCGSGSSTVYTTINNAFSANTTVAGDTLYIRAGTYAEKIDSNARTIPTGTSFANAPLIAGYPGETVNLNSIGFAAPSGVGQSTISYVIFDNLHMTAPQGNDSAIGIWGAVHHVRFSNFEAANAPTFDGIQVFLGPGGGGNNEFINGNIHDNKGCFAGCVSGGTAHGLYIEQSNNLFENIDVHHNGQHGMQIYRSGGTPAPTANIIRNSKFHNNMQTYTGSGSGLVMSGTSNVAYNNLFYSSADIGVRICCNGPSGNKIYNNTIYGNSGDGINTQEGSGAIVKNNIAYQNGTNITNTASGTTFADNLCNGLTTGCTDAGNPNFVDPTATPPNFHLQASSTAAIDQAASLSPTVTTDYDGVARPQGAAYDIGAYEFVLDPPGPTTYYVAKTGNDSNNCTLAQSSSTPKLTITSAFGCIGTTAGAGTDKIVEVGAGNYAEHLNESVNGGTSWTNALIVRAATGASVWLIPTAGTGVRCVSLGNTSVKQYVIFDGINCDAASLADEGYRLGYFSSTSGFMRVSNAEIKNGTGLGNVAIGGQGHIIDHNNIHHSRGATDGIAVWATDSVIEYNNSHDNAWSGISNYAGAGGVHRNTYRNNTLHHNGTDVGSVAAGLVLGSGDDTLTYNNIIYSNTGEGIWIAFGGTNTRVYNNTLWNNTKASSGRCILIQTPQTSAIVQNNICWQNTAGIVDGGTTSTLSNNLTTDPLFVSAPTADFHLQSGSAAIDTGVTIALVPTDFLGIARPQGTSYDIGAYEFIPGTPPTSPRTYYTAKTGSDSNTCVQAQSTSTPKLTITAGATCLSAGDTLRVKVGTYAEQFTDEIPGGISWTMPVTVMADTGALVTITPSAGQSGAIYFTTAASKYIILDGINLNGTGETAGDGLRINGAATHIRVQNAEIHHFYNQGILVTGATSHNNIFSNLTIHDNGTRFDIASNLDHGIVIETDNNIIERCTVYNQTGHGVYVFSAAAYQPDSNLIQKSVIHDNTTIGIGLYGGSGNDAWNNVIYDSVNAGIKVTGANSEISNNTIYSITEMGGYSESGSGQQWRNNIFVDSGQYGLWLASGVTSLTVQNNLFFNNTVGTVDNDAGATLIGTVTADPLFVSAATKDFHLSVGSGAVDTGVNLSTTVTDDIVGTTRPQNLGWDIGAYESIQSRRCAAPTDVRVQLAAFGLKNDVCTPSNNLP